MAKFYRTLFVKISRRNEIFRKRKSKIQRVKFCRQNSAAASERELLNFNPVLNKIAQKILKA